MKTAYKIIKFFFLGIIGLAVIVFIALQIYYQSIYKKTPLPPLVAVDAVIHNPVPADSKPVLLPVPKKLTWENGHYTLKDTFSFAASTTDTEAIKKIIVNQLKMVGVPAHSGNVLCFIDKTLEPQAYHLVVYNNGIRIDYNDLKGLFYAFTTLKQLARQSNSELPCVNIEDKPDMQTRGALLDISRGKVPTLETLYGMVDFLADLKYNQLQLYVEGFSFGYPSFKNLWEKTETPLTPAEIRKLDKYCKERYIELVPNQNSLGHMQAWLATDEYKDLAECPEGYKLFGLINMKTTIAPRDPRSLQLVKKMSEDLLPNFTSNKFNVNLDEPFELGKNKKNPIDDPKQVAEVYLNYAKKLNEYVNSKGKSMMMWGDVVSRNPEVIKDIPKNITLLEWGYEDFQPFNKTCPKYQQAGLHYIVCPGTSSWSSFTGRTDNMMRNVENAVENGIRFGADGMLMTDWGDSPHLQYLPVSYAGFSYAGALSWNDESRDEIDLAGYLSKAVFKDSAGLMGALVLEAGNYYKYEEFQMLSSTTTSMSYRFGIMDKTMLDVINKKIEKGIFDLLPQDSTLKATLSARFNHPEIYNAKAIISLMDGIENQLDKTKLNRKDGSLIIAEYKNAFRMVKLGALLKQYNNYHLQQNDADNKTQLTEMKTLCNEILKEHDHLWLSRNKRSDLEQSKESFIKLKDQINDNLDMLGKNSIVRWLSRSMERAKSAAAVLYLQ
ncbi:MAG TPA: family 20 glycosylhydrolase [Hanamia sp.]|nr:family 20 glycosylhydrolase [Hanamia sp.]